MVRQLKNLLQIQSDGRSGKQARIVLRITWKGKGLNLLKVGFAVTV
jgi:hypothetical protein